MHKGTEMLPCLHKISRSIIIRFQKLILLVDDSVSLLESLVIFIDNKCA